MKKIIRLTESDLTRIVKRVIQEQSNDKFTNKTVNLYRDPGNKDFITKAKVEEVDTYVKDAIGLELFGGGSLHFSCLKPTELIYTLPNNTSGLVYNKSLTAALASEYCATSSGGASVPKADFTQRGKPTGSDFA